MGQTLKLWTRPLLAVCQTLLAEQGSPYVAESCFQYCSGGHTSEMLQLWGHSDTSHLKTSRIGLPEFHS